MKKSFYIIVSILINCLAFTQTGWAQNTNSVTEYQLALQFFRNGEYQKSAELFQKLYSTNRSQVYFQYYLNSLVSLQDFDKAEELLKDQIKQNKEELGYWVELGYIYSLQKNETKAKNSYQTALKKLRPDQQQVIRLANSFNNRRLFTLAEETYYTGRKLLNNSYGFEMELAQVNYYLRNYDKMISFYLDILKISDMYLQNIQNQLQNAVYNDVDNSLKQKLKEQLLLRINQNPNVVVYSELLIWLYIQDLDFEGAFIQARALDLRLNENGQRIISLARAAFENKNFELAVKAYEYVIGKGKNLEYYFAAREELLEVMYERVILGFDNQLVDFQRLESAFISAVHDLGTSLETLDLIKNLAHLQAFYLGKTASARFLIDDLLSIPRLNFSQMGMLKLELADIFLLEGEVWDATFLYAQIEEDNKENPIGSEAKFRKSKLAYFIGDFEWARAQLDVLKASTSKLIANDAADLSLFIYENTGWDTIETALQTYARADFLFYQAKDSLAILTLDTVISVFNNHEIVDDAWFLRGKILQKQKKYTQAVESFQVIVDSYSYGILTDNALFALAQLYEKQFNDKPKAMEFYHKIMMDFPDSIYKIESRNRYRLLRGDHLVN